ncbi:MAG: hypothetical protein WCR15_07490 [Arcobacteraceae bacterium]
MNLIKMAAIVLIAVGIVGLVYGNISYTKEVETAQLGPVELSITDKETINIPVWAGVGAIVVGSMFLLIGRRKL